MNRGEYRRDARAVSKTLARGTRLGASRLPDNVIAASREERELAKLRRRIARWSRFHRIR